MDFASVKPSVLNWLIVGLMAVTFIVFFKWAFTKVSVPGLSDLFAAA
jgi:heme A synthase